MTLDPSPSFVDLLLWDLLSRHEVVFPVHQHLYHLVLERVVFFFCAEKKWTVTESQNLAKLKGHSPSVTHELCAALKPRASASTSCTEGKRPPAPGSNRFVVVSAAVPASPVSRFLMKWLLFRSLS